MIWALIMILVVLSAHNASAQLVLRDVQYGESSAQKLDLYPSPVTGSPIVVLIHGGAWFGGSKSELSELGFYLQQEGYAVASIDHRVSWQATFPANIEDVTCAVAYLKTNASTFNGDAGRMALLGQSSGGHLAALQALTGIKYLRCTGHSELAIDAVIGVSGIYSFSHLVSSEPDRLQQMLGDSSKYWKDAEPLSQLDDATSVKFLLLTSAVDHIVPPENTYVFYDSLLRRGAAVEVDTFYMKDHVTMLSNVVAEDSVIARITVYLDSLWAETQHVDTRSYEVDVRFVRSTVLVTSSSTGKLYLFDLLGRLVQCYDVPRGVSEHHLWDVPYGHYFVTVVTGQGRSTVQVILE